MIRPIFRCALAAIAAAALVSCAPKDSKLPATQALGAAGEHAATPRYAVETSRLVSEDNEIISVLKNGMTVVVKRVPSPVVSVRGYVGTGGVYEGQWLGGGLSHLLEHLVAGGTNDRRSEAQNRNLLQKIGNNSNAYTTYDHTAYFVNTTVENLEPGIDLVTGWLFGAAITPAEYAREYEVVQRELEKDKGEPDWVFYELCNRNRYTVSPARVPVIGYQEVIQGLSRDDVYGYYKLAYQPQNITFCVTGDVEPERMLQAVLKHADVKPGREFSHNIAPEPLVTAPRTSVATFPKLGQARLQLGYPSVKITSDDMYALDLLATMMGRGESSILVEEIRDHRSLVSGISVSDYTPHFVDGTFMIDMELESAKIGPATAAVLEQIERIKKEGVSDERLKRAKTQTRAARAFSQQKSEDVASSLATDLMATGDPHFSDRYVERMEKVTAQQVREAALKYLDAGKLLTTALVPEEDVASAGLPKAQALLRAAAPTTRQTPDAASEVTRVVCKDGTVLLLKRVATAPTVQISMYGLGGLTLEDEKTNGLGNLCMQSISRGTKRSNAQQIAEFFDSIGGDFSASCGNNTWSWSAACLKDDVARTLPMFAELVSSPSFPEDEVKQVRQRVLAAIASQDADWFAESMRFFRKTYFGPEQSPYRFMAPGTKENVEKLSSKDLANWYSQTIARQPKVLAIYGDIDPAKVRPIAAGLFGGEQPATLIKTGGGLKLSGDGTAGAAPNATPSIDVQSVQVHKSENPQAGVIIGFRSASVIGEDSNFPLDVADTLCSGYGYPTGYIFEILRGRGLVYDANAYVFPGRSSKTPGAFIVYAGCDPKNVNEVIDVCLENIARLQGTAEDMQPDWFDRAKTLITTSEALDNETPAAQATQAALDELYGLGYKYHDRFADKIGGVSVRDVRVAASGLLSRCVVTVNTSAPELVKVKDGVRTYQTFRPVDLTPRGIQHDSK